MDFRQNYFELFGIAEGFEIDLEALSARYRDLQRALHPDKFASAPEQERRLSMQQSTHVNTAFQVLKDPLSRARYILSLRGVDDQQEQATIRDLDFLEEQMELRETLGGIRNSSNPQGELLDFLMLLDSKSKTYFGALAKQLANDSESALTSAKNLLNELQFIRRLQQDAEMLEDELL